MAFARERFVDASEGCERLPDDLVHVVVAIGCEPADEPDVPGRAGKSLVLLVERLVVRRRDRIIGIALGGGIFIGEGGERVLLSSKVLVLGDAGVGVGLRIVHDGDALVPRRVEGDVLEAQRAIGQGAEAPFEVLVDRAGVDHAGDSGRASLTSLKSVCRSSRECCGWSSMRSNRRV